MVWRVAVILAYVPSMHMLQPYFPEEIADFDLFLPEELPEQVSDGPPFWTSLTRTGMLNG